MHTRTAVTPTELAPISRTRSPVGLGEGQWLRLNNMATTYPLRYAVMGCEGTESAKINGVYIISKHWSSHRPVYVKFGIHKLWLKFKEKKGTKQKKKREQAPVDKKQKTKQLKTKAAAEQDQQEETSQGGLTGNWFLCDSIDETDESPRTEDKYFSKSADICGEWSVPDLRVIKFDSDQLLVWLPSFIILLK